MEGGSCETCREECLTRTAIEQSVPGIVRDNAFS